LKGAAEAQRQVEEAWQHADRDFLPLHKHSGNEPKRLELLTPPRPASN